MPLPQDGNAGGVGYMLLRFVWSLPLGTIEIIRSRMDGIIILDDTRYTIHATTVSYGYVLMCSLHSRPIIQTNFRNSPASYPLVHIDAFNSALNKAQLSPSADGRVEPVIFVHAPTSSERTNSVCCHVERNGLWFLCPVSVDGR